VKAKEREERRERQGGKDIYVVCTKRTQNISVSGRNKRIIRNNYESTSVWVQAQVAQASPTRLQA